QDPAASGAERRQGLLRGHRLRDHGSASGAGLMRATIYHNPRCSNSRGALEILREAGVELNVIEYLDTPPDAATLQRLLAEMKMPARALLREKEAAYAELGLADAKWSE